MKTQKHIQPTDHHCTVLEQKHLVSEMTHCDQIGHSYEEKYECYLNVSKESRENQACLYS